MPQVVIDLPDSLNSWLNAEAAARRTTVGTVISDMITEKSGTVGLDANENHLLRALQNVSNKRGWVVPARVLWTNWQVRGSLAEMSTALEGLVKKGLLNANPAFTEFQLSEAGFVLGRA
jgi:hypothetical protein